MQHLKITVVMPSFNQGQFLDASIRSVLDQGYENLEFIVIDGGSSDDSVSIIRRYEPRIDYWRSEKDSGQSSAINFGFRQSSGDILCWLNSDDMHLGDTLGFVNDHFRRNDSSNWLVGGGQFVNAAGQEMWSVQYPSSVSPSSISHWYDGGSFHQPSVFWRRSLWESAGELKEDFHQCMDVELWLRFVKQSEPMVTSKLLSRSTDHATMKTRVNFEKSYAELCHALFLNGFEKEGMDLVEHLASKAFFYKKALYPVTRIPMLRRMLAKFKV